jgi:hypothetical protein
MIKKMLVAVCLLCLLTIIVCAGKKKKSKCLSFVSGTYTITNGPTRIIGTIFELDVKTTCSHILIDSMWFGNTPVPCDVINLSTKNKVDSCAANVIYRVRGNKDLYKNFASKFDSTAAYNLFKAPFAFKGEAVIFYKVNGVRYYLVGSGLTNKAPKPYRK